MSRLKRVYCQLYFVNQLIVSDIFSEQECETAAGSSFLNVRKGFLFQLFFWTVGWTKEVI